MSDGISVNLKEKYFIVVDPDPRAHSVTLCPDCGQFFSGDGRNLQESMSAADAKMAQHECANSGQKMPDAQRTDTP